MHVFLRLYAEKNGVFQMQLELAGWDGAWAEAFASHKDAGLLPGRVFTHNRHIYSIYTEAGETTAELAGALLYRADEPELPVVGDWITFRQYAPGDLAIIHEVLPRRSRFSRKAAGRVVAEQVMAANIDILFVVCGLDHDYNLRRLERYLAAAAESGAPVVIVLTKADLCSDVEGRMKDVGSVAPGVPIIPINALSFDSASSLLYYLESGRTAALIGSSGAGKSTIVNQLLGANSQETQPTRESDGRGRHTTTQRELFILPSGGLILDNPGIRELQLWSDPSSLESAFPEIETLAGCCEFRDCSHQADRGCAVQEALVHGKLSQERWRSYLKLQRELRHTALQFDDNARRDAKQRIKKLCKGVKRNRKRY
jgi:ribosome biogenesis GTPase